MPPTRRSDTPSQESRASRGKPTQATKNWVIGLGYTLKVGSKLVQVQSYQRRKLIEAYGLYEPLSAEQALIILHKLQALELGAEKIIVRFGYVEMPESLPQEPNTEWRDDRLVWDITKE